MLRVLIFYDVEGWAWWHKAMALRRHMGAGIAVTVQRFGDPFQSDSFDYIICFASYMLQAAPDIPPKKALLGLSALLPDYILRTRQLFEQGRARAIFANSREGWRQMADLGQAFCCQNGVDAELFHPASALPAVFTACWVGNPNSEGQKGHDLIAEACARENVPLLTASCDSPAENKKLVDHKMLRDSIYHKASIYICSSQSEATPNPALESMACGLPVLTTPVGNMPEIITHGVNGLFVEERSTDGIARGLRQLRDADVAAMGRAARESILSGWTWPQQAAKYREMILTLARADGKPA